MLDRFRGTRSPSPDFAAVRSDLQTTPLYVDIDLTVGRSLAGGTALDLALNGNVVYIDQKANSGYASMHFNDDAIKGNTGFTVFPGFLARVPFTKIIIENDAQPGITMRLIYGVDLDFVPAVSPGSGVVSIVDGGKARTLANAAFLSTVVIGGVAAEYSHLQLLNPTGSGKNVILEQLWVATSVASMQVIMTAYSIALSTMTNAAVSKKIGGAAGVAELRRQNGGTQLTSGLQKLIQAPLAASTLLAFPLREPIVLAPGSGVIVQGTSVNVDLQAIWEHWEETA
jgi:hypothetical protein